MPDEAELREAAKLLNAVVICAPTLMIGSADGTCKIAKALVSYVVPGWTDVSSNPYAHHPLR